MSDLFLKIQNGAPTPSLVNLDRFSFYDCVVDASGGGDYTLLSQAISAGKKTIFIRKGVYVETANIVLPEGFAIYGESVSETIIVFDGAFGLVYDGSGGTKETSGNITQILRGSSVVTGSGTTWTNLLAGDFLSIYGVFYKILSVDSNTQVTLERTYQGFSVSVATEYIAQTMYQGGTLKNLMISSNTRTGVGITYRGVMNCSFDNIAVVGCHTGINITDCHNIYALGCLVENNEDNGINLENCFGWQITSSACINNKFIALNVECAKYSNVIVDNCIFSGNSDGISVDNSEYIEISNSFFVGNSTNGVQSVSTSNLITISGCYFDSNKKHIGLQSLKTVVSNCILRDALNGKGASFAQGELLFCNNIVVNSSNDGIATTNSSGNTIFSNNYISNSGISGILIGVTSSSSRNTIINNIIEDNAEYGVVFNNQTYDSTIIEHNQFSGNVLGNLNLPDSAILSLQSETYKLSWKLNDPSATTTNIDGIQYLPFKTFIKEITISLEQRGETGNTEIDVVSFDTTSLVVGTAQYNISSSTLYTSVSKPKLEGDTSNATQSGFLRCTLPDIKILDKGTSLMVNITEATVASWGLTAEVIFGKVPE